MYQKICWATNWERLNVRFFYVSFFWKIIFTSLSNLLSRSFSPHKDFFRHDRNNNPFFWGHFRCKHSNFSEELQFIFILKQNKTVGRLWNMRIRHLECLSSTRSVAETRTSRYDFLRRSVWLIRVCITLSPPLSIPRAYLIRHRRNFELRLTKSRYSRYTWKRVTLRNLTLKRTASFKMYATSEYNKELQHI